VKPEEQSFGLRYLLICLAIAFVICVSVELICILFGIAPLFTPNLAVNEKMRFIRDHQPGHALIGVISGASGALNDVDSDLLQEEEHQPFINLGANALPVTSSQRLYNQFGDIFPVREVIFAAIPFEMRDGLRASVDVPTPVFRRYVLGKMTAEEEFTYRDISGMLTYWKNWRDYHSRAARESLVFSNTGAVPLEIGRDNAVPELWNGDTIVAEMPCEHCTDDLTAYCKQVRSQGQPFTVVLPPMRPEVLERRPDVRAVDVDRRVRIRAVVQECGGTLFDASQFATFGDGCFADSAHLNSRGMSTLTALLVRFRRGESIAKGTSLPCVATAVTARSSLGHGGHGVT
jgi:hypothetical protein